MQGHFVPGLRMCRLSSKAPPVTRCTEVAASSEPPSPILSAALGYF
jgi:hypothetical protein